MPLNACPFSGATGAVRPHRVRCGGRVGTHCVLIRDRWRPIALRPLPWRADAAYDPRCAATRGAVRRIAPSRPDLIGPLLNGPAEQSWRHLCACPAVPASAPASTCRNRELAVGPLAVCRDAPSARVRVWRCSSCCVRRKQGMSASCPRRSSAGMSPTESPPSSGLGELLLTCACPSAR